MNSINMRQAPPQHHPHHPHSHSHSHSHSHPHHPHPQSQHHAHPQHYPHPSARHLSRDSLSEQSEYPSPYSLGPSSHGMMSHTTQSMHGSAFTQQGSSSDLHDVQAYARRAGTSLALGSAGGSPGLAPGSTPGSSGHLPPGTGGTGSPGAGGHNAGYSSLCSTGHGMNRLPANSTLLTPPAGYDHHHHHQQTGLGVAMGMEEYAPYELYGGDGRPGSSGGIGSAAGFDERRRGMTLALGYPDDGRPRSTQ